MDSLTQITLGAAVGEVILGKKIGNRALLWGAVGGTIPDLDVLSAFFVSEINELAYHRGFSHSIVFAILGAFVFGWLIERMYKSSLHKYWACLGWFAIPFGILLFLYRIFDVTSFSAIGLVVLVPMIYLLYKTYFVNERSRPTATVREWQWLFFWSLFTHPLLDCFTTYGTQLFQPFSDYRVAFNAISVADPIYTVPFLVLVILLSFYTRSRPIRRKLAWAGIIVSSAYLAFAVFNKTRTNQIWQNSLNAKNISYERYMTSPTILNNVLWYCLAESKEGYYYGLYSMLDKESIVSFEYTPRNEQLISPKEGDHTIDVLKWFSNGYYNITEDQNGGLQMNDLRFGTFQSDNMEEQTYIFSFPIEKKEDGYYELSNTQSGPPEDSREAMLRTLWDRIKGI